MAATDEAINSGHPITADGSCKTCRSKRPGGRWDGPPGLRPADLIRSVDEGCPGCEVLLKGIRLLNKDWEHANLAQDGVEDIPSFDVYEGKNPGQESIVVMLTINRPKSSGRYEKIYRTWLEFFTLADRPSSLSRFGPAQFIPDTLASEEFVDQAKEWLTECNLNHPDCKISTDGPLPTRILDLEDENGNPYVSLRESQGMTGKYACLSYRWGSSKPFVTTTMNRALRSTGFATEALPATLRDAVCFTRKLGLRYLWIDALCILQDDRNDWERESANMSRVYGQSYFTLCASHTSDISDGLFTKLDQARDGPFLLQEIHNGQEAPIYVRRELSHHQFISLSDAAPGIWAEDRYPLIERAWALQEHLLSPRVIQFATHELVWECWEHMSCACGRLSKSRATRSDFLHPPSQIGDSDIVKSTWNSILHAYSPRATTEPGDRLPALSGLAHSLEDQMNSRYLAGIWDRDFANGLLWYKPPSSLTRNPRRPNKYRAPSWSWASVDGHIFHSHGRNLTLETQIAKINEAQTVLSGSDPMGAVSGGHIRMETLLTEIRYEYTESQSGYHYSTYMCKKNDLSAPFNPSWAFELPGADHVPSGMSFPCIILGHTDHTMAIVLRELGSVDRTFERVGSFFINESKDNEAWFQDAKMTQLTII